MTEFLFNFGLFAAKSLLLVALIALALGLLIALVSRQASPARDHLEIIKLGERLKNERETLEGALMDDVTWQNAHKEKRAQEKAERKTRRKALKAGKKMPQASVPAPQAGGQRRLYVLDFDGDLQASAVGHLRRELTAILSVARPEDEVVIRLESGGGLVHSYGLAASQLKRVRRQGVKLTVCVDKVAASGGYMMACVADRILAAPFAVIGSIGVVAQLPNFHRLLKKHDVDFELITAGEYKRTLTVFGENTDSDRAKFQQDLEDTHSLFQEFVQEHRPGVDITKVSTGEVWWGSRALQEKLVDQIETSDEYLVGACETAEVLEVKFKERKSLQDKLMSSVEAALDRTLLRLWSRASSRPLS